MEPSRNATQVLERIYTTFIDKTVGKMLYNSRSLGKISDFEG
jgi:hypothetical protein